MVTTRKGYARISKGRSSGRRKKQLSPLGGLEVVTIICDGIKRKRGMIDSLKIL